MLIFVPQLPNLSCFHTCVDLDPYRYSEYGSNHLEWCGSMLINCFWQGRSRDSNLFLQLLIGLLELLHYQLIGSLLITWLTCFCSCWLVSLNSFTTSWLARRILLISLSWAADFSSSRFYTGKPCSHQQFCIYKGQCQEIFPLARIWTFWCMVLISQLQHRGVKTTPWHC